MNWFLLNSLPGTALKSKEKQSNERVLFFFLTCLVDAVTISDGVHSVYKVRCSTVTIHKLVLYGVKALIPVPGK